MGIHLGPESQVHWNRAQLQDRSKKAGETARDFGNVIRRLVDTAYPTVDIATRDMMAKDQYVAKIGSGDVRVQLRSRKPANLEAAINLAAELEHIKTLEEKETVAAIQMLSVGSEGRGVTHQEMQLELQKLQNEICELSSSG